MLTFDNLIGRIITGVFVSKEGQHYLKFTIKDDKDIIFYAYGDCCSESWIADVIGVPDILDSQVISTQEMALPEPKDNRSRQESDSVFGLSIKTRGGSATIVFRNSSNGYYGGNLIEISEEKNRRSMGEEETDPEKIEWIDLSETNDYSA